MSIGPVQFECAKHFVYLLRLASASPRRATFVNCGGATRASKVVEN